MGVINWGHIRNTPYNYNGVDEVPFSLVREIILHTECPRKNRDFFCVPILIYSFLGVSYSLHIKMNATIVFSVKKRVTVPNFIPNAFLLLGCVINKSNRQQKSPYFFWDTPYLVKNYKNIK